MLAAIFAAIAPLEQVFGGENDEPLARIIKFIGL
jgi:hypothetical protein